MLAKVISIKLALTFVVVFGAATAFAAATSGDRPQPEAKLDALADVAETGAGNPVFDRQPIQSERGGRGIGGQDNAPTAATRRSDATSGEAGSRTATGPDATGQAKFGLCQAFAWTTDAVDASNGASNGASSKEGSVAYRNLAEAAAAAGQSVADFCRDVSPPSGDARQGANQPSTGSRPTDVPPTGSAPGTDRPDPHRPDLPPGSPEDRTPARP
jgi:hypothetical protein